jgi:inorganic pyrophosphatase
METTARVHGAATTPSRIRVTVETPKWTFVKYDGDRVEYVSPVPCPWNYGYVAGTTADDGDPLDALVLGRRVRRGESVDVDVRGVVRFRDGGRVDDKLVCGDRPLTSRDRAALRAFFAAYSLARRVLNLVARRPGDTRFLGLVDVAAAGARDPGAT